MILLSQGPGPKQPSCGKTQPGAPAICALPADAQKALSYPDTQALPGSPALSLPGLLLSALAKAERRPAQLSACSPQPACLAPASFSDSRAPRAPSAGSLKAPPDSLPGASGRAQNNLADLPGLACSKPGPFGLASPDLDATGAGSPALPNSIAPAPEQDGASEPRLAKAGQSAAFRMPSSAGPAAAQSAALGEPQAALARKSSPSPENSGQRAVLGHISSGAELAQAPVSRDAAEPAAQSQTAFQLAAAAFFIRPDPELPAELGGRRKAFEAEAATQDEACSVAFRLDFLGSAMNFEVSMDSRKNVKVRLGAQNPKAASLAAKALLDAGLPSGFLGEGENHGG